MSNVKVAVRVRPINSREIKLKSQVVLAIDKDTISLTNIKVAQEFGDSREKQKSFTFDYCYSSLTLVEQQSFILAQETVYNDLGVELLDKTFEGYNACILAYGQTGTGKTYTMMGTQDEIGLIPRLCEGLFQRITACKTDTVNFKVDISYLEIYNERVRDLLRPNQSNKDNLRIREHPKNGPYVEDLTWNSVKRNDEIQALILAGNANRTTAVTNIHEHSSRSHAIVTISFTQMHSLGEIRIPSQARLKDGLPSEIISKMHLVDLAGSERPDTTVVTNYRGRIKESGKINTSLVTLGNVIKALAERNQSKPQSDKTLSPLHSSQSSTDLSSSASSSPKRQRGLFIPYRNSVLTWLLKDSLGGNSKTTMIATVTPSSAHYSETLSTLRYAQRAKQIINRPKINEDSNVQLIVELKGEIERLRSMLAAAHAQKSCIDDTLHVAPPPQARLKLHLGHRMDTPLSKQKTGDSLAEKLKLSEKQADHLTRTWIDKWREKNTFTDSDVSISSLTTHQPHPRGVIIDSQIPHLISVDDDILSTGVTIYHLKEGSTRLGVPGHNQDIVLQGHDIQAEHCVIHNQCGVVTLHPTPGATCAVNGVYIVEPISLSQGDTILLGSTHLYRYNNPAEATKLRRTRQSLSELNLEGDYSGTNPLYSSMSCLSLPGHHYLSPSSSMDLATYDFTNDHSRIKHAQMKLVQIQKERKEIQKRRSDLENEVVERERQHNEKLRELTQHLELEMKETQEERLRNMEELERVRGRVMHYHESNVHRLQQELERLKQNETQFDHRETQTDDLLASAIPITGPDGDIIREHKVSIQGQYKELANSELLYKMNDIHREVDVSETEGDLKKKVEMCQEKIRLLEDKLNDLRDNSGLVQDTLELDNYEHTLWSLRRKEAQLVNFIQNTQELLNGNRIHPLRWAYSTEVLTSNSPSSRSRDGRPLMRRGSDSDLPTVGHAQSSSKEESTSCINGLLDDSSNSLSDIRSTSIDLNRVQSESNLPTLLSLSSLDGRKRPRNKLSNILKHKTSPTHMKALKNAMKKYQADPLSCSLASVPEAVCNESIKSRVVPRRSKHLRKGDGSGRHSSPVRRMARHDQDQISNEDLLWEDVDDEDNLDLSGSQEFFMNLASDFRGSSPCMNVSSDLKDAGSTYHMISQSQPNISGNQMDYVTSRNRIFTKNHTGSIDELFVTEQTSLKLGHGVDVSGTSKEQSYCDDLTESPLAEINRDDQEQLITESHNATTLAKDLDSSLPAPSLRLEGPPTVDEHESNPIDCIGVEETSAMNGDNVAKLSPRVNVQKAVRRAACPRQYSSSDSDGAEIKLSEDSLLSGSSRPSSRPGSGSKHRRRRPQMKKVEQHKSSEEYQTSENDSIFSEDSMTCSDAARGSREHLGKRTNSNIGEKMGSEVDSTLKSNGIPEKNDCSHSVIRKESKTTIGSKLGERMKELTRSATNVLSIGECNSYEFIDGNLETMYSSVPDVKYQDVKYEFVVKHDDINVQYNVQRIEYNQQTLQKRLDSAKVRAMEPENCSVSVQLSDVSQHSEQTTTESVKTEDVLSCSEESACASVSPVIVAEHLLNSTYSNECTIETENCHSPKVWTSERIITNDESTSYVDNNPQPTQVSIEDRSLFDSEELSIKNLGQLKEIADNFGEHFQVRYTCNRQSLLVRRLLNRFNRLAKHKMLVPIAFNLFGEERGNTENKQEGVSVQEYNNWKSGDQTGENLTDKSEDGQMTLDGDVAEDSCFTDALTASVVFVDRKPYVKISKIDNEPSDERPILRENEMLSVNNTDDYLSKLKTDLESRIVKARNVKSLSDSAISSDYTDAESTSVSPRNSRIGVVGRFSTEDNRNQSQNATNATNPSESSVIDRCLNFATDNNELINHSREIAVEGVTEFLDKFTDTNGRLCTAGGSDEGNENSKDNDTTGSSQVNRSNIFNKGSRDSVRDNRGDTDQFEKRPPREPSKIEFGSSSKVQLSCDTFSSSVIDIPIRDFCDILDSPTTHEDLVISSSTVCSAPSLERMDSADGRGFVDEVIEQQPSDGHLLAESSQARSCINLEVSSNWLFSVCPSEVFLEHTEADEVDAYGMASTTPGIVQETSEKIQDTVHQQPCNTDLNSDTGEDTGEDNGEDNEDSVVECTAELSRSNESITYVFVRQNVSHGSGLQRGIKDVQIDSTGEAKRSHQDDYEDGLRHKFGIDDNILPFMERTVSVDCLATGSHAVATQNSLSLIKTQKDNNSENDIFSKGLLSYDFNRDGDLDGSASRAINSSSDTIIEETTYHELPEGYALDYEEWKNTSSTSSLSEQKDALKSSKPHAVVENSVRDVLGWKSNNEGTKDSIDWKDLISKNTNEEKNECAIFGENLHAMDEESDILGCRMDEIAGSSIEKSKTSDACKYSTHDKINKTVDVGHEISKNGVESVDVKSVNPSHAKLSSCYTENMEMINYDQFSKLIPRSHQLTSSTVIISDISPIKKQQDQKHISNDDSCHVAAVQGGHSYSEFGHVSSDGIFDVVHMDTLYFSDSDSDIVDGDGTSVCVDDIGMKEEPLKSEVGESVMTQTDPIFCSVSETTSFSILVDGRGNSLCDVEQDEQSDMGVYNSCIDEVNNGSIYPGQLRKDICGHGNMLNDTKSVDNIVRTTEVIRPVINFCQDGRDVNDGLPLLDVKKIKNSQKDYIHDENAAVDDSGIQVMDLSSLSNGQRESGQTKSSYNDNNFFCNHSISHSLVDQESARDVEPMESRHNISDEFTQTDFTSVSDLQRELDKMQLERLEILEMLSLKYLPNSFTIEMLEAKLHYCIGQTDLLLAALSESSESDEFDDQNKTITVESVNIVSRNRRKSVEEYLSLYKREFENSKKTIRICMDHLDKSPGRGRPTHRNIDVLKARRQAQIEAFKLERMREESEYLKAKLAANQSCEMEYDAASASTRSMTPSQHREHLVHLRKTLVEASRNGSPCPSLDGSFVMRSNGTQSQSPEILFRHRSESKHDANASFAIRSRSSSLSRSPHRLSFHSHDTPSEVRYPESVLDVNDSLLWQNGHLSPLNSSGIEAALVIPIRSSHSSSPLSWNPSDHDSSYLLREFRETRQLMRDKVDDDMRARQQRSPRQSKTLSACDQGDSVTLYNRQYPHSDGLSPFTGNSSPTRHHQRRPHPSSHPSSNPSHLRYPCQYSQTDNRTNGGTCIIRKTPLVAIPMASSPQQPSEILHKPPLSPRQPSSTTLHRRTTPTRSPSPSASPHRSCSPRTRPPKFSQSPNMRSAPIAIRSSSTPYLCRSYTPTSSIDGLDAAAGQSQTPTSHVKRCHTPVMIVSSKSDHTLDRFHSPSPSPFRLRKHLLSYSSSPSINRIDTSPHTPVRSHSPSPSINRINMSPNTPVQSHSPSPSINRIDMSPHTPVQSHSPSPSINRIDMSPHTPVQSYSPSPSINRTDRSPNTPVQYHSPSSSINRTDRSPNTPVQYLSPRGINNTSQQYVSTSMKRSSNDRNSSPSTQQPNSIVSPPSLDYAQSNNKPSNDSVTVAPFDRPRSYKSYADYADHLLWESRKTIQEHAPWYCHPPARNTPPQGRAESRDHVESAPSCLGDTTHVAQAVRSVRGNDDMAQTNPTEAGCIACSETDGTQRCVSSQT